MADSACSATAYLSGVKANYGTMGISANVLRYNCNGQNDPEKRTTSIAKWAQDQCKVTGLVTTSKVTDATPGGLYSRKFKNRFILQIIEFVLKFTLFFNFQFTHFDRYCKSRLGE